MPDTKETKKKKKPTINKANKKKTTAKKQVEKSQKTTKAVKSNKKKTPPKKAPAKTNYLPVLDEDPKESVNKGGRPPIEITDELLAKAEALGAQLLSNDNIALALGMGERTFYEKKAKYPQFSQAIEIGRAKTFARVSNKAVQKAVDGDNQMINLITKTQMGWTEKVDPNSAPAVNITIDGKVAKVL